MTLTCGVLVITGAFLVGMFCLFVGALMAASKGKL